MFVGNDNTTSHHHKKEIALWVSVGVVVLMGMTIVIVILLNCGKKRRLSRNNLPTGKFLLMTL